MKAIQFFTDEYLETSRKATPTQIAQFLEDYRKLHGQAEFRVDDGPTKLISLRLPLKMLAQLKALSKSKHTPYQSLMKQMLAKALAGL